MPAYGLGTWLFGGGRERDLANDDKADISAIETALSNGVTHIDTGESYAAGHAETLVGAALRGTDREQLLIATKFSGKHAAARDVITCAEASIKRLGVEYLDLYMPNFFNGSIPLEETLGAMCDLVDRGLVKWMGVSNFGVENLRRAQSISRHPIVVDQVHYNVVVREVEATGLLDYCKNNDVLLSAWRPMDFGAPDLELLAELCAKYNASPRQLALSWLTSQDGVVTICKTASEIHLRENLNAVAIEMTHDDIEWLRNTFPLQLDVSPVSQLDH